MGKSDKKKKEKDFQRKKLVVGKVKAKAIEIKKVTIKVNSFTIPQTIVQTLGKANTLQKIEIINKLSQENLKTVIEVFGELVKDNSDKVRKKTFEFFKVYFKSILLKEIEPFFGFMLVHVLASLTNLNRRIRITGVEFVLLLLTQFPSLISYYGLQILDCLMDLLGSNVQRNNAFSEVQTGIGNEKERELVLKTLYLYLCLQMKQEIKIESKSDYKWIRQDPFVVEKEIFKLKDGLKITEKLVEFYVETFDQELKLLILKIIGLINVNSSLVKQHIEQLYPFEPLNDLTVCLRMNLEFSFICLKDRQDVVNSFVANYLRTTSKIEPRIYPLVSQLSKFLQTDKKLQLLKV
jgi:hypothetical protein